MGAVARVMATEEASRAALERDEGMGLRGRVKNGVRLGGMVAHAFADFGGGGGGGGGAYWVCKSCWS